MEESTRRRRTNGGYGKKAGEKELLVYLIRREVMDKSIVVLTSGGLDSTILLAYYLSKNWKVYPLFIDYGQKHWSKEHLAIGKVINHYRGQGIDLELEERDAASLDIADKFFIPMRNAHLLTIAVNWAYHMEVKDVGIGANKGEFPDQRAEFMDRFNFLTDYCFTSSNYPWVQAPFCNWTKRRVFNLGLKLGAPLGVTVSCMHDMPCGKCISCELRIKSGLEPA